MIAATTIIASTTALAAGKTGATVNTNLAVNDYFLSAANPMATTDQRDIEAHALELIKTPALRAAREDVAGRWKKLVGTRLTTPRAQAQFDAFIGEYLLHYTVEALNSDPNYPRVVRLSQPAHEWFGMKVPGARYGGDNPDSSYAIIPIAYGVHYRLSGRLAQPRPAEFTFSLMGNITPSLNISILEGRDLEIKDDGSFTLTLGPEPSAGRANHIQTDPDAKCLFVRDTRGDWRREIPIALRIERLDPPTAPPLTTEQLATRAGRFATSEVPMVGWLVTMTNNMPVNRMSPPVSSTGVGGLASQQTSFGRLQLADDEAIVITVGGGGAVYHNLVLHDFLLNTLEPEGHQTSMNNAQAVPNEDGGVTYVISIEDPGVHNWLDPIGWSEGIAVNRWQSLPRGGDSPSTSITTTVVKMRDLKQALPLGTRMVSVAQRKEQLARRGEELRLRFADR